MTFLDHSLFHFLLRYLEQSRLWPFLEQVPQFLEYGSHVSFLYHFCKISIINEPRHVTFLIIVNIKVNLAEPRKTKKVVQRPLLLLEHYLGRFDYPLVLFRVTHSGFLELAALDGEDDVVLASLKDLKKNDHLLVFQQVKFADPKVEWVTRNHPLDLFAQLGHHRLVKMPITPLVKRVGCSRIYGRPTSQRLRIADDEEGEAQKWHRRSVQKSSNQYHSKSDRQKEGELQKETDDLSLEPLLLVFHGCSH